MSVDWGQVLLGWQTDSVALAGLTLEAMVGLAYVLGVRRVRSLGRGWPADRTVCFLVGLACLALVLQSGFSSYDDGLLWVHMTQHLVLMMLAAPLLAWGAPVRLWFAAGTRPMQRFAAGILHDPSMRLVEGRKAAVLLPLDYYGAMALAVLTPLFRLSETSAGFHEFVHIYFLLCGLMFWVPVLGHDPAAWRPSFRLKVWLVGGGRPDLCSDRRRHVRRGPVHQPGPLTFRHPKRSVDDAGRRRLAVRGRGDRRGGPGVRSSQSRSGSRKPPVRG